MIVSESVSTMKKTQYEARKTDCHLATLIPALMATRSFGHPIQRCEIIETHISVVLLAGLFAYKFKKSVNFGFVDFSSLKKRKYFVQEELRLNKRLAGDLYIEVVMITGTSDAPVIGGTGPVIEYALKMKQFPVKSQLNNILEFGRLRVDQIDQLANTIADFHQNIPAVSAESAFGSLDQIRLQTLENFDQISARIGSNLMKSDN